MEMLRSLEDKLIFLFVYYLKIELIESPMYNEDYHRENVITWMREVLSLNPSDNIFGLDVADNLDQINWSMIEDADVGEIWYK